MTNSGFVHGPAEEFDALQTTYGTLRADYTYTLGSGLVEYTLQGADRTGRSQFKILAIRAASALPNAGTSGLHTWLEALRLAGGYFNFKLAGIETNADGSDGAHYYAGTIPRVCARSADLYRLLEGEVLEAEFLQKKQARVSNGDDPKTPGTELPEKKQEEAANVHGLKNGNKTDKASFPDRAVWLRQRLRERGWNKHDVFRKGGPVHKSVQKILDGRRVREDLLESLATALSKAPPSKKLPVVNLDDIPQS